MSFNVANVDVYVYSWGVGNFNEEENIMSHELKFKTKDTVRVIADNFADTVFGDAGNDRGGRS